MYSSGMGLNAPARLFLAHAMTIRARSSESSLLSIAHEATPSTLWVGSPRNAVLAVEGFIPRYSASSSQKPESATESGAPSVPWGTLPLLKDSTSLGHALEVSYHLRGLLLYPPPISSAAGCQLVTYYHRPHPQSTRKPINKPT